MNTHTHTHTRRILIVDDDPLQVGLLRRQILRTGIDRKSVV